MTTHRSIAVRACVLTGALWVSQVHAADCPPPDEPLRHRIAAGAGYAGVFFSGGIDAHYNVEGQRGSAQLAYAYRPYRGLEGGADVVVLTGPVFLIAGTVRGYLPLGAHDDVELGLSAHFGLMVVPYSSTRTWTGWGTWVGPDVRVWVTERFGFQLAGQAFLGVGYRPIEKPELEGGDPYVRSEAGLLGLGGAFSVVMRN